MHFIRSESRKTVVSPGISPMNTSPKRGIGPYQGKAINEIGFSGYFGSEQKLKGKKDDKIDAVSGVLKRKHSHSPRKLEEGVQPLKYSKFKGNFEIEVEQAKPESESNNESYLEEKFSDLDANENKSKATKTKHVSWVDLPKLEPKQQDVKSESSKAKLNQDSKERESKDHLIYEGT